MRRKLMRKGLTNGPRSSAGSRATMLGRWIAAVLAIAPSIGFSQTLPAARVADVDQEPLFTGLVTRPLARLRALGLTVYGTVDIGVADLSHGAPLSSTFNPGLPYLLQKFSNRPLVSVAPSGLSPSKFGLLGEHDIGAGVSLMFRLETGFNPQSLRLSDGPKSLIGQNGRTLDMQRTSGDTSRAGQDFQGAAYIGVSSRPAGTLTYGRQSDLLLDNVARYDPQPLSQAFSPLGYSGVAGGGGDTEDARLDKMLKYSLTRGPVRASIMHQFGSRHEGFGADGVDLGLDYANVAVDLTYTKKWDGLAVASLTEAQAAAHSNTLAATVSDNDTLSLQGAYAWRKLKILSGIEQISYADPRTPLQSGLETIGGYPLGLLNNTAFPRRKILDISWVGARYAWTSKVMLSAAYYRYDQHSYGLTSCSNASSGTCKGDMQATSIVVDDQVTRPFDVYLGAMSSRVEDGMRFGFLKSANVTTMGGVRFVF